MPVTFRQAFSKMKGFKGDEKAWPNWRYKFRVEAPRCFRQAAAILDWAEDRFDKPISNLLLRGRIGLTWQISTRSFTVTWFLSRKSAPRISKLCATPEVELDAWRPLKHKYGPRKPLTNIQLLERFSDVVASMEGLEQELRVVRQRFW